MAALRGGSGKTTVSLGLVAAWRKKNLRIIPFKKGPDYIDAGWLAQAAGSPCYNLDPFLMERGRILRSFTYRVGQGADGAVIEGNRGLYDGTDEQGTYSTAELAKLLNAPVVLVVECAKVTRTLAAIVYGCQKFDPDLWFGGVILNQVATGRQENLVRRAIESSCGLPVLGAVPRVRAHDLPERHLGLVPHQEHPSARRTLNFLAEMAEKYLDLDALWSLAGQARGGCRSPESLWPEIQPGRPRVRIGVIRDSALSVLLSGKSGIAGAPGRGSGRFFFPGQHGSARSGRFVSGWWIPGNTRRNIGRKSKPAVGMSAARPKQVSRSMRNAAG